MIVMIMRVRTKKRTMVEEMIVMVFLCWIAKRKRRRRKKKRKMRKKKNLTKIKMK